jgi:hypothetical protein
MEGFILFLHGNDFFDIRKDEVSKFKEMNILKNDVCYEKDEDYYFTEIKEKNSKIYDFDTSELVPVLRKFGKYSYAFLANKDNLNEVKYALVFKGRPHAFRSITFIAEDWLLPKFGVNFFYLDYENKVEGKLFLMK